MRLSRIIRRALSILVGPGTVVDEFKGHSPEIIWRPHPGCHERHLQRRCNNPLFPPSRRHVTLEEVGIARKKDDLELAAFDKKVLDHLNKMKVPPPDEWVAFVDDVKNKRRLFEETGEFEPAVEPPTHFEENKKAYHDTGLLIKESLALGQSVSEERELLIKSESATFDILVSNLPPDAAQHLTDYQAMTETERIEFLQQANRPDSPILQDEEIPSLLSEDLESIRRLAFMYSVVQSNTPAGTYVHSLNEVEEILEHASKEGLDEKKKQSILNAVHAGIERAQRNDKQSPDATT